MEQLIVVRGEAERPVPADVAALTVVVQVDDADQARAFDRAGDVATAVDAVLEHRAPALGTRRASVVVVRPTSRWVDGEEQRTGWRAERTTTIDVVALDQVSPLLAELVGVGAVVHGPAWRLRPGHPAVEEAREAAAADARSRAERYATGLGVAVGRVEWIAEPGLRLPGGLGGVAIAQPLAFRRSAAGDEAGMSVEPAELVVAAAVEVGFAIERR